MKKRILLLSGVLLSLFTLGTQLDEDNCNREEVSSGDYISAVEDPQATFYQFELTNKDTDEIVYLITPNNYFTLSEFSNLFDQGTTYTVRVRITINEEEEELEGEWEEWGDECEIATMEVGASTLTSANCSAIDVEENDILTFSSVVDATSYEVVAHKDSVGDDTITVLTNQFSLGDFTNLPLYSNTVYDITVRPMNTNIAGSYGQTCSITTIGLQTTQLTSSFCNILNVKTDDWLIAQDMPFAQQYRFFVQEDLSDSLSIDTFVTTEAKFKLADLEVPIRTDVEYYITVQYNDGANWSTSGATCKIATQAIVSASTCTDYDWVARTFNTITTQGLVAVQFRVTNSTTDLNGNLIVAGHTWGPINPVLVTAPIPYTTGFTMFVASIAPNGTVNWVNTADPSHYASQITANDIVTDENNDIYVIGTYSNTSTSNDPTIFNGTGGTSISLPSLGSTSAYLETFTVKYSQNGVINWVTNPIVAASSLDKNAIGGALDIKNGNLIAMHTFRGTVSVGGSVITNTTIQPNVLITKIDPSNGSYTWAKSILTSNSTTDYAEVSEVKVDDNTIYISGNYRGSINFEGNNYNNPSSGYVAKLDLNGDLNSTGWFKSIEGGIVSSIELSNTCKNLYVTGFYGGNTSLTIDSYTIPIIGNGSGDNIFITSMDEMGVAEWLTPIHGFLAPGYSALYGGIPDNLELDEYDNLYINADFIDLGVSGLNDVYSGTVEVNTSFSPYTSTSFTSKFLKNGEPVFINDVNNISTVTFDKGNNRYFNIGYFYHTNLVFGNTTLVANGDVNYYFAASKQTPFAGVTESCIEVCPDESIPLEAFAINGTVSGYDWSPNTNLDATSQPIVNFKATLPGIYDYVVQASSSNGCYDKAHVEVTVLDEKPQPITQPNQTTCVSSSNFFLRVSDPTNGTWTASCGTCIDATTGEFSPDAAGVGKHDVFFNNICNQTSTIVDVLPGYVCCLGTTIVSNAIILSGVYDSNTPLPSVPSGADVILEQDVIIDGINNILWDNVHVYAESIEVAGDIEGASLTLVNSEANFSNSIFESACDQMWEGIKIGANTSFISEKNEIRDAMKGIELLSYTAINNIINTTFFNNYYSIVLNYQDDYNIPNSIGTTISGNTFNSDGNLKQPFNGWYTQAHLYHQESNLYSTKPNLSFPNPTFEYSLNSHNNAIYGITASSTDGVGMVVDQCTFENCFIAGIYDDAPYENYDELEVNGSTFTYPVTIPSTPQLANYTFTYGIKRTVNYIHSFNNFFNDALTGTIASVGISSEYLANINVEGCEFNNLGFGIRIKAFGGTYLRQGNINTLVYNGWTGEFIEEYDEMCQYNQHVTSDVKIVDNDFNDNAVSIHYLNNSDWLTTITNAHQPYVAGLDNCNPDNAALVLTPQTVKELITQDVHCNDFKIDNILTKYPFGYGIFVEGSTSMNDFGDCDIGTVDILPGRNQWPIDPSLNRYNAGFSYPDYLPASNWYSIFAGSGSNFDYYAYHNEYLGDASSVIGIMHPEDHKVGGFNSGLCNNVTAASNQCGSTRPNIIFPPLRPANTGEEENTNGIDKLSSIEDGLGNAYPNPATQSFTVPFYIDKVYGEAQIEVFDLKSSSAVIMRRISSTKGEVIINTNNLSDGVYMYRLVIDGTPVKTKSIIIMK